LRLPSDATLIVIDLQYAIDAPYWVKDGPRNNPDAEAIAGRLLDAWRAAKRPVIIVRHDSREPNSAFRPGQPGNDFKPEARPQPGETVIAKQTTNAFIDTGLEQRLRDAGCTTLVVCGVSTSNSVESTVRMAGDLGFTVYVVEDACFTFAKRDWAGTLRSAAEVHAMALANMDGEFATIARSETVMAALR